MRQVIYYPGILIPSDWLRKTILYSNKISSIYPYSTRNTFDNLEEEMSITDMNYLESLGMYEYTRPEDLSKQTQKLIFNDLIGILNETSLDTIRNNYSESSSTYEIYTSKMSEETKLFLLENRVASDGDRFSDSIFVEENVGLLYMSLLAQYSTSKNPEYTTATDILVNRNLIYEKSSTLNDDYQLNLILENIPSPSPSTSIEEIVNFKKEHEKDLLLFRGYINDCPPTTTDRHSLNR